MFFSSPVKISSLILMFTVMVLIFLTDKPGQTEEQTVQTQIRLLPGAPRSILIRLYTIAIPSASFGPLLYVKPTLLKL